MKKLIVIGMGLLSLATLAGLSLTDLGEYVGVASRRLGRVVDDSIPLSVEIDRVELLLDKLDEQVTAQKRTIAKAQIALEDAEADLSRQQDECQQLVIDLRQLRSLQTDEGQTYVRVGCQKVATTVIRQGLSFKLAAWKEATAARAAREQAVEKQRCAFEELTHRFREWQQERRLLSYRLETLRSRLAAQQMTTDSDRHVFDDADLARTKALANRIEKELRTIEAQQELDDTPLEQVLIEEPVTETSQLEDEVDAIINRSIATD